jgi:hypothetical protein
MRPLGKPSDASRALWGRTRLSQGAWWTTTSARPLIRPGSRFRQCLLLLWQRWWLRARHPWLRGRCRAPAAQSHVPTRGRSAARPWTTAGAAPQDSSLTARSQQQVGSSSSPAGLAGRRAASPTSTRRCRARIRGPGSALHAGWVGRVHAILQQGSMLCPRVLGAQGRSMQVCLFILFCTRVDAGFFFTLA